MTQPVVLLIDAGFRGLGMVVVRGRTVLHAEACRTEKSSTKRGVRVADDDTECCLTLARALLRVINTLRPAGAIVEMPTGGAQGARPNRTMGMATGVVAAVLEATGLAFEVVTPAQVKKAATGKRDGSKEEVQSAVRRAYNWEAAEPPDTKADWEHIADAAAAGLAAENGTLMRALNKMAKGA